jgi:hypothetical protein
VDLGDVPDQVGDVPVGAVLDASREVALSVVGETVAVGGDGREGAFEGERHVRNARGARRQGKFPQSRDNGSPIGDNHNTIGGRFVVAAPV